jgi:hypothetical protein
LRTPSEAGAAIKFRRRVEIADGVHDVVETVRHSMLAFAEDLGSDGIRAKVLSSVLTGFRYPNRYPLRSKTLWANAGYFTDENEVGTSS